MARVDLSLEELRRYSPTVAEPADFDDFWRSTLEDVEAHDLDVRRTPVSTPYRTLEVHDVTFTGFGGDRIRAWEVRSLAAPDTRLPAVVEFIGYNGGRDLPGASASWANAGYVHLLVDTRGQGSEWGGGGSTPDPHGAGPHVPGFLTSGIEDPRGYYYRRVFTDAVRAVEAVRTSPSVDPDAVAVQGISQGGGITLAASGLAPGLVAVMPDVPFLCHFERAVDVCDQQPYVELTRYLAVHRASVETVFGTLGYFDAVNHARRATAPALFSVGLMDKTCPPSTVFAAYSAYAGPKDIVVYPYNDHEGGLSHQRRAQIHWLDGQLGR
jgi:cephalosporin-C deacetylase